MHRGKGDVEVIHCGVSTASREGVTIPGHAIPARHSCEVEGVPLRTIRWGLGPSCDENTRVQGGEQWLRGGTQIFMGGESIASSGLSGCIRNRITSVYMQRGSFHLCDRCAVTWYVRLLVVPISVR